jgi:hypothetical protein
MWVGHENLGPEKFSIVLRQAFPFGGTGKISNHIIQ